MRCSSSEMMEMLIAEWLRHCGFLTPTLLWFLFPFVSSSDTHTQNTSILDYTATIHRCKAALKLKRWLFWSFIWDTEHSVNLVVLLGVFCDVTPQEAAVGLRGSSTHTEGSEHQSFLISSALILSRRFSAVDRKYRPMKHRTPTLHRSTGRFPCYLMQQGRQLKPMCVSG